MPMRSAFVRIATVLVTLTAAALPGPTAAQSLGGSRASLDLQNRMASQHDFSFLSTATQVRRFVDAGYLVPVVANADFELHRVSYPYARPEVRMFLERLAAQYRSACGERLVVTSLTRPESDQPRNASDRSVHPTGMAIDLRLAWNARCRSWLERVLLQLERARVLEATRERRPAHYHVAVFPRPYAEYVALKAPSIRLAAAAVPSGALDREPLHYRVRSGDSLWAIARRHGLTVAQLQRTNELASSRIVPGQVIELPVSD